MKKYLLFLSALTLIACKNELLIKNAPEESGGASSNNQEETSQPEEPTVSSKIISSYIRNNFLETNRISAESMNACNDLIILGINPYADGSLYFEIPNNRATFTHEEYLADYNGRSGVIAFSGEGEMNGGNDLLHTPVVWGNNDSGKCPQFTFGTWIFMEKWTEGACLFQKDNSQNKISLATGPNQGDFIFTVNHIRIKLSAPDFITNKWTHLALTYSATANNKGTHLYINGKKAASDTQQLTDKLPYIRSQVKLGNKLDAKLDETFFNALALSENEISKIKDNGIEFTSWNMSKTLAYWKYDNATNYGADSHNWVDLLQQVRTNITRPDIKIRAGITSGDWKTMCSKEEYRNAFANNIKKLINEYKFDGVDLDFEWPLTQEEYNNYSQTILKLREVIGNSTILTVSLHPLYFKISQEAINAVDHISLQCYGPSPQRFPYDVYVKDAEAALNYGITKEKLILGLPFYGAEENKQGTASYWDFVQSNLINTPDTDEVIYKNKKYIFNGQNTIRKKTQYVMENDIAGIMTWDLATDLTLSDPKALLKVIVEEMKQTKKQ